MWRTSRNTKGCAPDPSRNSVHTRDHRQSMWRNTLRLLLQLHENCAKQGLVVPDEHLFPLPSTHSRQPDGYARMRQQTSSRLEPRSTIAAGAVVRPVPSATAAVVAIGSAVRVVVLGVAPAAVSVQAARVPVGVACTPRPEVSHEARHQPYRCCRLVGRRNRGRTKMARAGHRSCCRRRHPGTGRHRRASSRRFRNSCPATHTPAHPRKRLGTCSLRGGD